MDDSVLLKTALLTTILGLIFLFYVLQTRELPEKALINITDQDIDKLVKITGKVVEVKQGNNLTRIIISQENTIMALIFEDVNVSEGYNVTVEGKVEEYMGKKEILIERIELSG